MEKYKLINSVTKIETLCDKVTIDGFDYYVSDEEIKSWDFVGFPSLLHWTPIQYVDGDLTGYEKKIIATNNPNIDIPKVIDEVERLAIENSTNKIPTDIFPDASEQRRWNFEGFVEGYNKSQETHPFSEEDMIEFAEWRRDFEFTEEFSRYEKEELLQLWKEQKHKIVYYE